MQPQPRQKPLLLRRQLIWTKETNRVPKIQQKAQKQ